jgi:NADH-quinone oxidoreductase subunit M
LIVTLSAIALPGTSGFTGEFLMLIGSFQTQPWAAGVATTAAIWSAVYMLWMFQRVMHGPIDKAEVRDMADVTDLQKWALVPLVAIIVFLGVYPTPALNALNSSVTAILSRTAPAPVPGSPLDTQQALAPPVATGGGAEVVASAR